MSTYFYALKEPWSNIKVEETPDSYRITLWDGHGNQAGTLTLRPEDGSEAIYHFAEEEPACQRHAERGGPALRIFRAGRTATLVSDLGDVTTFADVRATCQREHGAETHSFEEFMGQQA